MAKYQAYAEYKDSGVEWLGEIPSHWEYCQLKRYLTVQSGDMLKADEITEEGIPIVGGNGYRGFTYKSNTSKNTIVIGRVGAKCGCVHIITESFWASEHAFRVLPRKNYNLRFMAYFLENINLNQYAITTAQPLLNTEIVTTQQLCIPTRVEEQAEIANFLDHETAKIDHLIEKQQQLIELLKEKRQAVISHAVTKGLDPNVPMKDSGVEWLGEVPEHWSVKKLKYIVDLVGEKVESSNKQYVGMENISSKSGVFLQTEGILPEGISNTFNKGDILFGKLRPYLAKCWLADFSGICSSEFLVLRSKNKLSPIFLNLFLLTDQFIDQVNSSTYGSKMPRANWEFIGDLPIPVPDEQSSIDIANFLERQTQKYDSLIIKVSQQIALMQERRTALISAAVTGKIDVRHWQSPTVAETQTELSA